MGVGIKIDDKGLKQTIKKLSAFPKEIPKATVAALNRTATFANNRIKKEVIKKYSIKSAEVQQTLTMKKATTQNLTTYISSEGRRYTLAHFERNLKSAAKRGGAVKVQVKKGGTKTVNTQPGAFVASMSGPKKKRGVKKTTTSGIFLIAQRVGAARYPIKVLRTLSVPQMISSNDISEIVLKESQSMLQKRIEHEVEYRLSKLNK